MTLLEHSGETARSEGGDPTPEASSRPAPAPRADAGDLSSYARDARRSLRGALVGAAVGLCLTGLLLLSPSSYTATTTVKITPVTSAPFDGSQSASNLIDPPTEVAVAESDAVFDLAVTKYGPLDVEVDELRANVEVTPIDASTVLEVAVTADTAEQAQRQADAVAQAYLERRAEAANDRLDALAQELESSIAAVDAERTAAGARFKAAPPGSEARELALADHRAILAQRDSLTAQLQDLRKLDSPGGEVLTFAESVPTEVSPAARQVLASGIVGGAVVGFVIAFAFGQLGTRVRQLPDLQKVPALRFTAEVRKPRRGSRQNDAEVFRALREQRKIDGWPETPYSTVLTLDLRRSLSLDTPLAFAQALAQEHGSATILALGWDAELQDPELDVLGFRRVSEGRHITNDAPPVGLRTFARDDAIHLADAYLTNSASAALESLNSLACPIVVWCPGSCGEATRLALLSRSDTLMFVVDAKRNRLSELRRFSAEAAGAGVAWVGALLVR
jgi:capsular polysaccharide biosynthesis protein